MDMDLKQARAIARSVGATIEEKQMGHELKPYYVVRLGVCRIASTGTREYPTYSVNTPGEAANYAVLNTAKICNEMAALAKQVYVDSDLIYMAAH